MSSHSQPERVENLEDLDDDAFLCTFNRRHSFGGQLPRWVKSYTKSGIAANVAVQRCECGTVRKIYAHPKTWEPWPHLTWYGWPDGYLLTGGQPAKADLNREAARRVQALEAATDRVLEAGGEVLGRPAPPISPVLFTEPAGMPVPARA